MSLAVWLAAAMQTELRPDPRQALERTCFQTSQPYSDRINLKADVAIVYGIGKDMPARIKTWRDRGYRIHVMTGVAWGEYQDYLYGRFDGINHEDEVQTQSNGEKIGHGGDVYYMSPGKDYGKYLCTGVQRALDAGAEAIHLEEPEFWVRGGYGPGFKREWQDYYHEPWQAPDSSPDARWRAAKLMYYLYRRALQQVFDFVQAYNAAHSRHVRCYVPTHSLLNYASWGIVSPESSLAKLNGCDGYIAQVWTGTARTPNTYRGVVKERTFETAFLEYGAMQNLVRATGRRVWYLADPVEDDANHDWGDYRRNWESTLTASLLQPDVVQYEVMPWPERIFNGRYPSEADHKVRVPISGDYASELQVVINALKDMKQGPVEWQAGPRGIGVGISDSLMFQRGGPSASDPRLDQIYGLAMPFLKRGVPVQPVQLENVTLPHYLDGLRVLLLSYEGQKPLSPDVNLAIAAWVHRGGKLVFLLGDDDPFNRVREWWNTGDFHYERPDQHLYHVLGTDDPRQNLIGKGQLLHLSMSPSSIAHDTFSQDGMVEEVVRFAKNVNWTAYGSMILRRGPYVVAAGMDETDFPHTTLKGSFIDLFDPALRLRRTVEVGPGARCFLVDLNRFKGRVVASAGEVQETSADEHAWEGVVEGIADTPCVLVLRAPGIPASVTVNGKAIIDVKYHEGLVWLRFPNSAKAQTVRVAWSRELSGP
jgi:hypothetical protein